ncbi:hypothetical protein K458DRAFT_431068 [Lentithecium fluviatile CBS 122367]|uniref:Rad60/SUMO-like domain-containing protein n=1 Tax=Lentithecium fluviatile CBS 122367 TaxID=1168545 RepID=A0A6G1J3H6_9PLEO|nr:hypothetical protein K458DRAFT_431068 [Lentithecium fluviatile CBS 122367]
MTDSAAGAAAPRKKRFAFKKAAWQTAPKADRKEETDMFSHSNEFRDIVAEQTQRKHEEKKKAEESRKRKLDEERERKRRKVSTELHEKIPGSGSASSARGSRLSSKARSETPLSPIRNSSLDTFSKRYDSLAKSSSAASSAQNDSHVMALGDSDDDFVPCHKASPTPVKQPIPATQPIPIHSKRASSEELEEIEDPKAEQYRAAARERRAKREAAEKAAKEAQAQERAAASDSKPACVQLLITSQLPYTRPIMVKVRIDATIGMPRVAWCEKQGFTQAQTDDVFLSYKDRKVFDSTTIHVLGIKVDEHGNVSVPGDTTIYDETNLPKIHLYAWTPRFKEQWDKEAAEEAAARKKAAEAPPLVDETEAEQEPELEKTFKVVLVEKGQKHEAGVRMIVRPETDFGHLASAYKEKRGISKDQPITLIWDGDRLSPMDTIADTDLENMDTIEVHYK